MKKFFFALPLLALAACAPQPEVDYCTSMGTPSGHPEFGKCTQYYFQKQAEFQNERAVCEAEADRTYPKSLYSRPYSYPARFYGGSGIGFSRGGLGMGYGGGGGFGGFGSRTEMVHVGADYQQIAEVDRLRMSIIEPCMQRRGWNSGQSWEAGRRTSGAPARPQPIRQKLPWQ